MVWLFGQIWLWLIVAFALGALSAWLVLRTTQTTQTAQRPGAVAAPPPEPEPYYEPEPAERTQFIPAANFQPTEESRYDDDTPEPAGHREGHLPLPPQRGAQAEDWPVDDEPAWPEADDLPDATHQWPPAPHQPGRGG
jgi:cell division protein FtsN